MENTSCGAKCPYVKTGFCSSEEECPHFVESWWQEGNSGQPKLVKDCVPKRLMIQISALHNRIEAVQAAAEQNRAETFFMKEHFMALLEASKQQVQCHQITSEIDEVKLLEKK